jgi:large subunit ribosomal protein L13
MHPRLKEWGAYVQGPPKLTKTPRVEDIERAWFVVDATDRVMGRVAAQVASVLRGKHKASFTPHLDAGDFVIIINAAKTRLTGRKLDQKVYYRNTGYPGGIREITARRMLETHPERMLEGAIRGMLPKNPLGRRMFKKLKVYADANHPHAAQKPQPLEVRA